MKDTALMLRTEESRSANSDVLAHANWGNPTVRYGYTGNHWRTHGHV